jgi:hypothetical protein
MQPPRRRDAETDAEKYKYDVATDEMPMDTDKCGENILFYLCSSDFYLWQQ